MASDRQDLSKTTYIIIHEHRHGADGYLLTSNHVPNEPEIVAALDLNWEPDREEVLTVSVVTGAQVANVWNDTEPHGTDCANRILSSAECTCGKADYFSRIEEEI